MALIANDIEQRRVNVARGHARTGDSMEISGYIGSSDRFGEVIADWAAAYADQTERDHAALLEAIQLGVLPAGA